MSGISNFITDLMERMEEKNADVLVFPVGSYCLYQKDDGTIFGTHHRDRLETDELREDFAALGITLKLDETYYYRYDPNGTADKESLFFIILMEKKNGKSFIQVAPMKTVDRLMKQILRDNNPVTASDYRDYAY